jgi:hypothetical protein
MSTAGNSENKIGYFDLIEESKTGKQTLRNVMDCMDKIKLDQDYAHLSSVGKIYRDKAIEKMMWVCAGVKGNVKKVKHIHTELRPSCYFGSLSLTFLSTFYEHISL